MMIVNQRREMVVEYERERKDNGSTGEKES